ncbi:MAG: gentisate 1,2-dioxygenase [Pseudomonadota bacterium]
MTNLDAFRQKISKSDMAPLWDVLAKLVTRTPVPEAVPAIWRFSEAAQLLRKAGELITAEEAERRVLILENPAMRGQSKIADSLYAGLQLILPGETAPAHRHTQSALRYVLDGEGAFTAVDGERATMRPGDFIITPCWRWHDHGNDSKENVIWLDGLDIPIVDVFKAAFSERHDEMKQTLARPEGDAAWRYGSGLAPVDDRWAEASSPVFAYKYETAKEALSGLASWEEPNPYHGHRLKYVNPNTGDWPMPTIAAYMSHLPKGFKTQVYRSSESRVWVATEGAGHVRIGDESFNWGVNDVFVSPTWAEVEVEAYESSFIFSFSDRSAQEKLGLFREKAGNAGHGH